MSKKNIDHGVESRVCFEQLEEWVRRADPVFTYRNCWRMK